MPRRNPLEYHLSWRRGKVPGLFPCSSWEKWLQGGSHCVYWLGYKLAKQWLLDSPSTLSCLGAHTIHHAMRTAAIRIPGSRLVMHGRYAHRQSWSSSSEVLDASANAISSIFLELDQRQWKESRNKIFFTPCHGALLDVSKYRLFWVLFKFGNIRILPWK